MKTKKRKKLEKEELNRIQQSINVSGKSARVKNVNRKFKSTSKK